jgi:hypothetical protein
MGWEFLHRRPWLSHLRGGSGEEREREGDGVASRRAPPEKLRGGGGDGGEQERGSVAAATTREEEGGGGEQGERGAAGRGVRLGLGERLVGGRGYWAGGGVVGGGLRKRY